MIPIKISIEDLTEKDRLAILRYWDNIASGKPVKLREWRVSKNAIKYIAIQWAAMIARNKVIGRI